MVELSTEVLRTGPERLAIDPPTVLLVEDLTVKVGIRRIVEGFHLRVGEGDMIRLCGPNGSGKSSLLNAIAGLEPAQIESGRIIFCGEDVTQMPAHERSRRGLAYMRQRGNIFQDLSVDENLRLAGGPEAPSQFRETHPEWATDIPGRKRASLLSGGQRQRLAWAMATLRPSRLLLADEPEAGMSGSIELQGVGTMLLVSHTQGAWYGEEQV